ncbi:hypothetical protein FRC12_015725 [Ceratobasidium sp. 428]|nr:hypothetical protein FRC12_015725 [Ceratobasidium sp. 428]
MPPTQYAQKLKGYAAKKAEEEGHKLDQDEVAANRTLKRKRVSIKVPHQKPAAPQSSSHSAGLPHFRSYSQGFVLIQRVASGSGSAVPQTSPASGPSQNVNGSEKSGRHARDEFVSKTIRTASEGGPSGAASTSQQPTANSQQPAPAVAAQTTQAQGKDAKDADGANDQPDQQPSTPDATPEDSDVDMENDPLDGAEVVGEEELKRLKELYKSQPTQAMKSALRSMLDDFSDAEAEMNITQPIKRRKRASGPSSNWVQDDDYNCTDGPRKRDEQRVILSGYIRVVVGELLKIPKDGKLPPGPGPEVAAPTAAAFYFKWEESEKSEFNAIAARIVASQIVKEWPTLFELDEVFDMVTGHFKYLRTCHRRQNVPEVIAKEAQRHLNANRMTRKHTLYNHRLRIIKTIPALRRHGRLFETLGIDGTSSDEEGPRKGVYIVRRKKQLSSKVTDLKRRVQVDQVFAIQFKGVGTKGNQLRRRKDSEEHFSTRKFRIKGLPISCMDPAWLATLTDVQKDMYEFTDHEYDFDDFPVELLDEP